MTVMTIPTFDDHPNKLMIDDVIPGILQITVGGIRTPVAPAQLAAHLDGFLPGLSVEYEKPVEVPQGIGALVVSEEQLRFWLRIYPTPSDEHGWQEYAIDGYADWIKWVSDEHVAQVIRRHGEKAIRFAGVEQ